MLSIFVVFFPSPVGFRVRASLAAGHRRRRRGRGWVGVPAVEGGGGVAFPRLQGGVGVAFARTEAGAGVGFPRAEGGGAVVNLNLAAMDLGWEYGSCNLRTGFAGTGDRGELQSSKQQIRLEGATTGSQDATTGATESWKQPSRMLPARAFFIFSMWRWG